MTIRSTRKAKTRRTRFFQAASLACALSVPNQLNAIEPEELLYYRVGNVSIRPSFGISETYNDNVFFRGDDSFFVINPDGSTTEIEREGDLITSLSGGASILLGRPTGNFINANYNYSHRLFNEHTVQNAGNHSLQLQGKLAGARIQVTPSIQASNTKSLLNGANRSAGIADQLVERNNATARLSTRIVLTPKTFTTSTIAYSLSDLQNDLPFFDTESTSFLQGFGFQLRPKVSLSLNGTLGRRSVDPNSVLLARGAAQKYFGGGFSAEGEFSDRLTGEISFGIQRSSFSRDSDSFVAPVASVSLEYLMGRDITSEISYTRNTFVGIQSANEVGVSDVVGLSLSKPLGIRKNWIISARGSMNFQNWENKTGLSADRSNDWLSGTLAVQYRIQEWLTSSFSYSIQSFSSSLSRAGTFGIVDYDVNTVSISMRVGY